MRAISLLMCVALAGCATPPARYFTDEDDAEARRVCQPAGCVIVPVPVMQDILKRLQGTPI